MRNDLANEKKHHQQASEWAIPRNVRAANASRSFFKKALSQDSRDEYYSAKGSIEVPVSLTGEHEPSLRMQRAPGFRIAKILSFLCREKTVELLIKPLHGELLHEYFCVLQQQNRLKAMYQRARIPCTLIYAVIGDRLLALLGKIFKTTAK